MKKDNTTIKHLKSGIPIIITHDPEINSTDFGILCHVGANDENETNNGISHFLEHMAFCGTKTRNKKEILQMIGSVGGNFNAFTDKEETFYHAGALSEHMETIVEVVSQNVIESTFDNDEAMASEKNVVLQEIAMYEDIPRECAFEMAQHATFPDSPLGFKIIGTREVVKSITPDTLHKYVGQHYTNDNMYVAATTNLNPEKVFDTVEKYLGGYNNVRPKADNNAATSTAEMQKALPYTSKVMNSEQYHVVLSARSHGYNHNGKISKASMQEELLALIFGGGFCSRFFQNLREGHGLCYATSARNDSFKDLGIFYMYIGTDKPEKALKLMREELKKPITEEEWKLALNRFKTTEAVTHENIHDQFISNALDFAKFGKIHSDEEINDIMNSISLADMEKTREYITSQALSLSVVGKSEITT